MSAALLLLGCAALGAPPDGVWATDLQSDDGGLAESGSPDQWAWGAIDKGPGEGSEGPLGWATRLSQVHMNSADDRLTLPDVSLLDSLRPVLILTHWHDLEPGDDDWGVVERRVDGSWEAVAPLRGPVEFTGSSEGWRTDYIDLTDTESLADVRLRFRSDEAVARAGWVVGALEVVDGDPVPPVVTLVQTPTDSQDLGGPHPVSAIVTDDVGVTQVSLVWFTGASDRREAILFQTEPGIFEGSLPGAAPGTTFVWWIQAEDAAGNVGLASGPSFRTFLPAPTDLRGPTGRWVDTTVPLTWRAPDSPWPIVEYVVSRNGTAVARTTDTQADAPVLGPSDQFTVTGRFETDDGVFEGDPSQPVAVTAYPPTILRVSPSAAWPGDTVHIELQGRYLLLAQDDVEVDLGPGVAVSEVEVVDADTLQLRADVSASAAAGLRTVVVASGDHEATAAAAFEVRTSASRPRIEATVPTRLVRGERTRLTVRSTVSLPDDSRLDLGTGVVVEAGTRVDDRTLRFMVAVATDAPTGGHVPELDIGTRLLTGPAIDIQPPQPAPQTLCGVGPRRWGASGSAPLRAILALGGLLGLGGLRRRGEGPPHSDRPSSAGGWR